MPTTILSISLPSGPSLALKLRPSESLPALKARCAKKVNVPKEQVGEDGAVVLQYAWCGSYYQLEDDDDYDIFLYRVQPPQGPHLREVSMLLTSPYLPTAPTSPAPPSVRQMQPTVDTTSVASRPPSIAHTNSKQTTLHVIASSLTGGTSIRDDRSIKSGKSGRSGMSKKSKASQIPADYVPEHKIAFANFHNQNAVRTVIGSIGDVDNVRMMIKPGHRHVYMSRAFAQDHDFIPHDAAPGFYGFSGITNLGSWPIRIGEKSISLQVQLVESAYFPIILGRSFMEKRGVKISPLDETEIIFMDTGEKVDCDLVIVKDAQGQVVPVS
ncbi:hypothetical protein BT69DRAFT_1280685 [Atractiella rhizophila]|nr:hypothetical protein BT69DRAFT_1280685 [Atractiella rhizophila]